MGANLGTGYVQIVPSAKGLSGSIANVLSPEATSAGNTAGGLFGGKLLTGATAAIIAGGAVVGAALVSLTKSAVEQYAEYEQLVGGAQLMFGDAYSYIAEKASGAYATVQMSQNEYLTQVNGFATGLKTALGGNEMAAAQLADKIITAEADIVAATGNTQENIQNAFNGIMKGNYTMLDNLQIGIKPTKEGFQEVIDKVNEYNAAQGNATNYTIDNLADCEAALVDYVAMVGMAGYAQNEAASTIQGSLAATKAAWSNLLVGMASGEGDINLLMNNLVTSATGLLGNVIPIIGNVVQALPQMIVTFLQQGLPMLLQSGADLVASIVQGIFVGLPQLATGVFTLIQNFATYLSQNGPQLITQGGQFLLDLVSGFVNNIPQLIAGAGQAITALVGALMQNLPQILSTGVRLLGELALGIIQNLPAIVSAVFSVIGSFVSTVIQNLPQILAQGFDLLVELAKGVVNAIPELVAKIPKIFSDFCGGFDDQDWGSIGSDIISGIKKGIENAAGKIADAAKTAASKALSAAKKFLGIESPSKVFRDQVGYHIATGMAAGIASGQGMIDSALEDVSNISLATAGRLAKSTSYSGVSTPSGTNLIGALYDVASEVVSTINSKEQNTYIDGKRVGGAVGNYNAQQMRRYGRVQAAY